MQVEMGVEVEEPSAPTDAEVPAQSIPASEKKA